MNLATKQISGLRSKLLAASRRVSRSCFFSSAMEMEEEQDDAFQVFDLPYRFQIDEQELKKTYRELMTQLHPDKQRHAAATQPLNSRTASAVTRAYDQLHERHTRATHLLQLLGYPIDESSNTSLVGGDFLMQIMELREAVDETNSDDELRPLWKENEVRIDDTCFGIGQAIDAGNLEEARKLTAQLQYWNRIDETIREKMDQLDED